jgi:hypothetical protein
MKRALTTRRAVLKGVVGITVVAAGGVVPLNMPPERVDHETQLGEEPRMAAALAEITRDARWRPTFAFRMGYADRPARLSPRRPIDAVL